MQLEQSNRKRAALSLTPLIDVVFLVLIFFMLASTFSRYSSLPLSAKSGQGPSIAASQFILVRIDELGSVDVNGTPTPLDSLISTIDGLAKKEGMKLVVKAKKGASVQHLVTVLEQARKSKLKNPLIVR